MAAKTVRLRFTWEAKCTSQLPNGGGSFPSTVTGTVRCFDFEEAEQEVLRVTSGARSAPTEIKLTRHDLNGGTVTRYAYFHKDPADPSPAMDFYLAHSPAVSRAVDKNGVWDKPISFSTLYVQGNLNQTEQSK